jgi:predicted O-linked N-acetylglucosamine transferase (SPINDLY family)
MGVPVVTLPGTTSVSRAGLSILSNIDLAELVAASPQHFVQIASALASDVARLKSLRSQLRERLIRSPLCDGRDHAEALERAYRKMWQTWCAAQATTP